VLNQSFTCFELILVNDGSTDGSDILCRSYQERDPRVVYVNREKTGGISNARNTGLEHARGDYIAWMDSDDWADTDWLETMYNLAETCHAPLAVIERRLVSSHTVPQRREEDALPEKISVYTTDEALGALVDEDAITSTLMNKLFKRTLFDGVLFPRGRLFEDAAVMHILVSRCNRIAVSNKKKYNYFKRMGSITHRYSIGAEYERFLAYLDRLDFLKETGRQDLFLKEGAQVVSWSLTLEEMGLFHRMTPEEQQAIAKAVSWRNNFLKLENSISLDKKNRCRLRLINKNIFYRFILFMISAFPARLGFFVRSRFPSRLLACLRRIKKFLRRKKIMGLPHDCIKPQKKI
jgi:glycosyltransferase involved in cell wall biosynthesis